jgi:hypothetical protein
MAARGVRAAAEKQRRLLHNLLTKVVDAMHHARSARDRLATKEWRRWLGRIGVDLPLPKSLDERIMLVLYEVKDRVERLMPGRRRDRAAADRR